MRRVKGDGVCVHVRKAKWMLVEVCMHYRTILLPSPMTGANQDCQWDETNQRIKGEHTGVVQTKWTLQRSQWCATTHCVMSSGH